MSLPPDPAEIDPGALLAFRQQAAAIMARERGLTPSCRAKLAGLARRLGIADERFDEALQSLTVVEPSAPPNAQAEKFRRRLRKDLAAGPRAVIGPTIEAQILAVAKRKYGLADPVAAEVLADVATEIGLTRITSSDALGSLAAQIEQAIGDSTWLASETRERLRTAGAAWGVGKEVVDELIDDRLNANRSTHFSRSRWSQMILYCTAGAVALTVVVVAGLIIHRTDRANLDSGDTTTIDDVSRPRARSVPVWWSVDLSVEIAHVRSQVPEMAAAIDLMTARGSNERADGYERFLDLVRTAPDRDDLHGAFATIASECYLHETDDVAAIRIRTALVKMLPAADLPLPASWTNAFWAGDVCASALATRGSSEARKTALADSLSATLGEIIDRTLPPAELPRRLRQAVSRAAYRQLATAAARQPEEVAKLHALLSSRAGTLLTDEDYVLAETTFLVAALPAAGSQWRAYERTMARCIASPDSLPSLRMLEALRKVTDAKLVERLAELLTVRAGVKPKSRQKSAVIAAVRQALAAGSSVTAYERWQSLQDEVGPLLSRRPSKDIPELAADCIELAHFTTLAIALAQGEAGFAVFDTGLENPPQLAAPEPAGSGGSAAASGEGALPRPIGRPLSKTKTQELVRAIEILTKSGAGPRAERESALRGIAAMAGQSSEISSDHAASVAAYLLGEKSLDEHNAALAAAAPLRRWQRLRLATADALATATLPLERQRDVVSALCGRDLSGSSAGDMRRTLLAGVLSDLEIARSSTASAAADSDALDRAESVMLDLFRQRAALLNRPVPAASAPDHAIEACLGAVLPSSKDAAGGRHLQVEEKAVRYLAASDLQRVVGLEQIFVDRSAQRVAMARPQQAAAARKIAADERLSFANCETVLAQLRQQEAALLKIWMLYAPET